MKAEIKNRSFSASNSFQIISHRSDLILFKVVQVTSKFSKQVSEYYCGFDLHFHRGIIVR
jgi:hypothetical protein